MPGTRIGVLKQKAKRHGITVQQLERLYESGKCWCHVCKTWIDSDHFGADKSRSTGFASACNVCRNHKSTASRYGISTSEAAELRSGSQVCEICQRTQKLEVDHDHTTGAVRGMLCSRCNGALGQFCDSVEMLKLAIQYLEGGAA
jgi:hypothetical protein